MRARATLPILPLLLCVQSFGQTAERDADGNAVQPKIPKHIRLVPGLLKPGPAVLPAPAPAKHACGHIVVFAPGPGLDDGIVMPEPGRSAPMPVYGGLPPCQGPRAAVRPAP